MVYIYVYWVHIDAYTAIKVHKVYIKVHKGYTMSSSTYLHALIQCDRP